MRTPPKNLGSVEQLADRYSDELSAQFRTLNLFVQHAGEVGRAHEVFLRGVLSRFLPRKLQCGSGFIASPEHVTRQQDIIIYDALSLPILLEIGDCIVCEADAVAGTIEVKTAIDSAPSLRSSLDKLGDLKRILPGSSFIGLYAWEGLSLDAALECFWERYRGYRDLGESDVPDVLYVRGRYLITPNYDGRRDSAPLLLLRLGPGHHAEGAGLLSLIERMWAHGLQSHARRPWWVEAWGNRAPNGYEHVPWPDDLRMQAAAEVAAIEAARLQP